MVQEDTPSMLDETSGIGLAELAEQIKDYIVVGGDFRDGEGIWLEGIGLSGIGREKERDSREIQVRDTWNAICSRHGRGLWRGVGRRGDRHRWPEASPPSTWRDASVHLRGRLAFVGAA
ncbi:hypothetical protein H4Q26_008199 [Puccinia striiformis f. sp. tritici PST-130]|uniref:Uncharacterized protein n=1 Tax=Puccinia striiformis f. sp. tritici PST-78 TaxID=1165861 RepID=A0A0L0V5I1_9BASI|nr:hypothetical protein H4Q26_008199 [Puccinia striiformis f. sp. tritici PST-130]KNE94274.1 hypothetical protein PSTG_12406 [Puccinia striiformis f. sp. tritici PST-78]